MVSYRLVSQRGRALVTVAGGEVGAPVAARVADPSFCGRDVQAEQVREHGAGRSEARVTIAVLRVLRDWIPCSRRRLPSVLATWCRPGLKLGNSHLMPGNAPP